jgi:hypothetical protein
MSDMEERIRARAYELWEADGRPEGCEERHWHEAEAQVRAEIEAEEAEEAVAAQPAKPKARTKAAAAEKKPVAAKKVAAAPKKAGATSPAALH